ncbi:MAG: HEPN domain-containing protein [Gemmatimonadota bacterium]|nr:HEPN domain-containing protein [Gemmatimonadota bacterium]
MNRAHSSLARSRLWTADVYLEDLCFDAQQAAEKAIKGLLLAQWDTASVHSRSGGTALFGRRVRNRCSS